MENAIDHAQELVDSIRRARPAHFSKEARELARRWMYGLAVKLGRDPDRHSPDDTIIAQFLSIAPWPRLLAVLIDVQNERREVGDSYGWFVAVALQRVHGVQWAAVKKQRAKLEVVEPPKVAAAVAAAQGAMDFPAPETGDGGAFAAELLGKLAGRRMP